MVAPFENYVELAEAARLAGCHHHTLRRRIWAGKLPARLLGGRWLIERTDLARWQETYEGRPGRPSQKRFKGM